MMDLTMLADFLSYYRPEVAAVLFVTGLTLLLFSLMAEERRAKARAVELESYRDEAAYSLAACRVVQKDLAGLAEDIRRLESRQDQLTQRVPESGRFDQALEIIRNGAADRSALCEMGFNDGEARLLLRLHGEAADRPAANVDSVAESAQGKALARVMDGSGAGV